MTAIIIIIIIIIIIMVLSTNCKSHVSVATQSPHKYGLAMTISFCY